MRRSDVDGLFRYRIDPISSISAHGEHQRNDLAALVHHTDLQIRVGGRNRNGQPFFVQVMHIAHIFKKACARVISIDLDQDADDR